MEGCKKEKEEERSGECLMAVVQYMQQKNQRGDELGLPGQIY